MYVDLTKGGIKKQLMIISAPVIVTSFVKMLNNFVDLFWVNKGIGDEAIASIGIVALLVWLSQTIASVGEIGTQVIYAQALGLKEDERCDDIAQTGVRFNFYLSLLIVVLYLSFGKWFINSYKLSPEVSQMGYEYLLGVTVGIPFMFYNQAICGVLHAKGYTRTTFRVNTMAVVVNMILDPIFIFIFKWGTFGAGLATSIAQIVATILFIYVTQCEFIKLLPKLAYNELKRIFDVGLPNFAYNTLFIFVSMSISRVVATFGTNAVAVQQIGQQLEALSWMTAGGFSVAISSFVGQNVGAGDYKRAMRGVKVGLGYAILLGTSNTIIFFFFSEQIISLFLQDPASIAMGIDYMRIVSIAQIFMCVELVASGAFLGLSKAGYSSIICAIFTIIRIPMILYLSREDVLGLNGIWWAVVFSCILKGVFVNLALFIYKKTKIDTNKIKLA